MNKHKGIGFILRLIVGMVTIYTICGMIGRNVMLYLFDGFFEDIDE